MDKSGICTAACLIPDAELQFDVTCQSLNVDGRLIAYGTRQGNILLWKITELKNCNKYVRLRAQPKIGLKPYFLFLPSPNAVAFPVVDVAFACGSSPNYSLKHYKNCKTRRYTGVEKAEEVIVSLHEDNTLCVWSLSDFICTHKVKGPPFAINKIKTLPDRRFICLVGAYKINIIDLWKLKFVVTLEPNRTLQNGDVTPPSPSKATTHEKQVNFKSVIQSRIVTASTSIPPNVDYDVNVKLHNLDETPKSGINAFDLDAINASSQQSQSEIDDFRPMLLVALLENRNMVIWDLAELISNYKFREGSFHGCTLVVTEWDLAIANDYAVSGDESGTSKQSTNLTLRPTPPSSVYSNAADVPPQILPSVCEPLHDLDHNYSVVCVLDKFIFFLAGFRILVWIYEHDECIRAAELLALDANLNNLYPRRRWNSDRRDTNETSTSAYSASSANTWIDIKMQRLSSREALLFAWTLNGTMSIYTVPLNDSICRFDHVGIRKFKRLHPKCTRVDVLLGCNNEYDELIPSDAIEVVLLYILGGKCIISTQHSSHKIIDFSKRLAQVLKRPNALNGHGNCGKVADTAIYSKENDLYRIDLLEDATLVNTSINTNATVELLSPAAVDALLHGVGEDAKYQKWLMLGSDVINCLRGGSGSDFSCGTFSFVGGGSRSFSACGAALGTSGSSSASFGDFTAARDKVVRSILHVVSSKFLAIIVGTKLYVYSCESLELLLVISDYTLASALAIYSVYCTVADDLHSGTSTSASNSSKSEAVLVEDAELLAIYKSGRIVLVNTPRVMRHAKMARASFLCPYDVGDEPLEASGLNSLIYRHLVALCDCRGIMPLAHCPLLNSGMVERIVVNAHRDLVYVLTRSHLLLWYLSSGKFICRLAQLQVYRRALMMTSVTANASTSASGGNVGAGKTNGASGQQSRQRQNDEKSQNTTTIADTLASLLTTEWPSVGTGSSLTSYDNDSGFQQQQQQQSHTTRVCRMIPDDLLSLCMFNEKYNRRQIQGLILQTFVRLTCGVYASRGTRRCFSRRICRLIAGVAFGLKRRKTRTITREKLLVTKTVPVLIYPISRMLAHKSSNLHKLVKQTDLGLFCIVGTSGTLSIPMGIDARVDLVQQIEHFYTKASSTHLIEPTASATRQQKPTSAGSTERTRSVSLPRLPRQDSSSSSSSSYATVDVGAVAKPTHIQVPCYVATGLLLQDVYLEQHYGRRNQDKWAANVNVWLLGRCFTTARTVAGVTKLIGALEMAIDALGVARLHLHVARALNVIRCAEAFKRRMQWIFPSVVVCHCSAAVGASDGLGFSRTTFTFGSKCNSCNNPKETPLPFNLDQIQPPKDNEESISLLLLMLTCTRYHTYAISSLVKIGARTYSLAVYVAQYFLQVIFSPKQSQQQCQAVDFFLNGFASGFGTLWTLEAFQKQSILPDYIKTTQLSLAYTSGNKEHYMDTMCFCLHVFGEYHQTNKEGWLRILQASFLAEPKLVLDALKWVVKERRLEKRYIGTAIHVILKLVKRFKSLAVEHLIDIVAIIILSLDPSDPATRVHMVKPATCALFYLVSNLPMAAFHQDTQRFAVGSQKGLVYIYDVRTATQCKTFEGINASVTCLAFSSAGDYIAAYYKDACTLAVFKCSTSGLLGSLLHSNNVQFKSVKLEKVDGTLYESVKIQCKSNHEWFLHREDGKGYMISI